MQFTLPSAGKSIRVDATEPAPQSKPIPGIVLLHGAGGHTDFWLDRIAPFTTRLGVAVYAVHYFDRTGTTRATPAMLAMLADGRHIPQWLEAVRDAVAAIRRRPGIDPQRVTLIGISLGAFLSLALAAQGLPIRALVEISGGLVPPYEALATAAFPPVLIVHGLEDTIVAVALAHALDARLTQLGVPHQTELLPHEGHWFSPVASARILATIAAFLTRHL